MDEETKIEAPTAPVESAPEPIKKLILRVLSLEKERLYEERPRLKDEILRIIKEEIHEA